MDRYNSVPYTQRRKMLKETTDQLTSIFPRQYSSTGRENQQALFAWKYNWRHPTHHCSSRSKSGSSAVYGGIVCRRTKALCYVYIWKYNIISGTLFIYIVSTVHSTLTSHTIKHTPIHMGIHHPFLWVERVVVYESSTTTMKNEDTSWSHGP